MIERNVQSWLVRTIAFRHKIPCSPYDYLPVQPFKRCRTLNIRQIFASYSNSYPIKSNLLNYSQIKYLEFPHVPTRSFVLFRIPRPLYIF